MTASRAPHREFYGIDVAPAPDEPPVTTDELLAVFEVLRPRRSSTRLIRIGGQADGAYLVPDDLDGIVACFSPGANRIKYFEDQLAQEYGIRSHMCDFTCDADDFTTALRPGVQTFQRKWLDVTPDPDNLVLADWVRDAEPDGDLLLQMDIEGAEFRNVLAAPDELLSRFRVAVLEIHGLGHMRDGSVLRQVIAPFFAKLGRVFTSAHVHPNNCCGEFAIPGTEIRMPNVLELTLVRTDRFLPEPGPVALPHPLDLAVNVPRRRPLFLTEQWCGGQRPLESRVKMLEDDLANPATEDDAGERALAAALSLTMQSLRTVTDELTPSHSAASEPLVEVAGGLPYRLSSAWGSGSTTGTVSPRGSYFFHTGFGPQQAIEVDLGDVHRVLRIEVSNRRDGFRDRARCLFVTLIDGDRERVLPLVAEDAGVAWDDRGIDVPGLPASAIRITAPLDTALHLADLRVYAAAQR